MAIKKVIVGEIIKIEGEGVLSEEWLVIASKIGGTDKLKPQLRKVSKSIKGMYRKPYFNKMKGGHKA